MNLTNIKVAELINYLDNDITEKIQLKIIQDNSNKPELINLYNAILKNKQHSISSTTENLYKTVNKKSKHTPNEFRKLCHELFQKIEYYLSIITLNNNRNYQTYLLLQFYKNQQLFSFYEHTKNKLNKIEFPLFSSVDTQTYNLYNETHYETLIEDKARASENHILPYSQALDAYYILQKLKLICHALNESHFTTFTELPEYTEQIISIDKYKYNLLIQFYFDIAKLLQDVSNESLYFVLKEQLIKTDKIHQDDLKIMIQYLINFSVIKINKGTTNYISELFDWYKQHDKVIEEETILPVRFRNIINIAIRLKDFQYAFDFIERNGKKLPSEQRVAIIDFNKAKLYYAQKKYDEVIVILRDRQYNDITFNVSAKVLLAQTFYEKKEFQFLSSYLESFRLFIFRNKEMNTASKKMHQDFIKITHQLMKMEYASAATINNFKQKIEDNKNLPDKAWILEKITELV